MCLALAAMLWTTSCGTVSSKPVPIVANDCAWAVRIVPDPGWETRWTDNEKRQVVLLNRDVQKNCRR